MDGIVNYVPKPSPKQSEIVAELHRRIVSGRYAPGDRLPALAGIRREFDVSEVTAQRAVWHLREEGFLHVRPRQRTRVAKNPPHLCDFGFILPSGSKQNFFLALQSEAEKLFSRPSADGFTRRSVICHDSHSAEGYEEIKDLEKRVQSQALAGLIFTIPPCMFDASPSLLTEPGIPRVTVSGPAINGVSRVQLGDILPKSLDYLAERGRQKIGFICSSHLPPEKVREHIHSQVSARGQTTADHWIQAVNLDSPKWASHVARVLLELDDPKRPDALVIKDDNLVPAATEGIAAASFSVPDDLDVVAHTNFPYPTRSAVAVKRIGSDVRRLLKVSVGLIERWRRGEEVPVTTSLEALFDHEFEASGT